MAYLFPAMGEIYADLAEEAARSRVFAGAAFPSDVNAGLQLGRQVGQMVIAYAMADGSNTPFTGSFPSSPGVWGSATPVTPLAGSWKPWTLSSGSQFRLPAPPAASSPDFQAQVAAAKNLVRTNTTNHSAWFWQPSFLTPWLDTVNLEIFQNHLDGNAPRAARAYALEGSGPTRCHDRLLGYQVYVSRIAASLSRSEHRSFCAAAASGLSVGTCLRFGCGIGGAGLFVSE
jgi:hypothetical protein